jgi:lysophospholipase L1-like esterase
MKGKMESGKLKAEIKKALVPLFLLVMAATVEADPIVIWPKATPPPGTPASCFPVAPVQWLDYFQVKLNLKAKAGPVDLVFDGDSITDRWQNEKAGLAVWRERLADRRALDVAIGGDGIEHALWRLDHGEVDGLDPKLVVLMIGTNNIQAHTSEEVAEGVKNLVADYRKHLPNAHILLLGIFPRGAKPTDPLRAKIAQVNQSISSLDDGKAITFLDFGAKFLEPDGTLSAEMMPDFLHPLEKGYRIWADAIQPIVDQYCPKSDAAPAATAPSTTPTPQLVVTWPLPEPPSGTNPLLFGIPNVEWIIHWFSRFQNNLNQVQSGSHDLIFDGHDVIENLKGTGQDVWKERYAGIKVVDLAIAEQIQNTLWRAQHGELAGQDPKLVVLQTGFDWPSQNLNEIAQGIKLLVQEYETRCPQAHILLLGILPRGAEAHSPTRDWIASINKILATCDDGKRVTFLDIGPKFLQPDGTISKEIMPDFRQLSPQGYVLWADAIQPVVDRYFPRPAAK